MSRRRNKKSPPTNLSRAFQNRHFYRPLQPKPYFKLQQSNVQLRRVAKQHRRNLHKIIHRSPMAKKLQSLQPHVLQQVNRCLSKWSRLLSWRADQKQSGGRNRAPRSQREKAASAAKYFKHCN